jgi:hypothetical protein
MSDHQRLKKEPCALYPASFAPESKPGAKGPCGGYRLQTPGVSGNSHRLLSVVIKLKKPIESVNIEPLTIYLSR